MKITILQDDYPPHNAGGAGSIAKSLAEGYVQAGHTVLVITTVQDRRLAGEETINGLHIRRFYTSYPERWRAYLSLNNRQVAGEIQKALAAFRPEVVHAHNVHFYLSYRSLKIAAQSGARVFLTVHDVMLFHYGKSLNTEKTHVVELLRSYRLRFNPLRNFFIRRYLRYVTGIIAVSNALKEALEHNGIRNVQVIHNGINVDAWAAPAGVEAYKQETGIGERAVLFGGRLSGSKGGKKLIEALGVVAKTVPDAQLLVVGKKDDYAGRMLQYAKALGIEKNIIFTGWLSGERLRRAYYAAALVAVPSLYLDPFPTVTLEAMACRKPVVVTRLGGSPEAVEDGVTGYVVDPSDVTMVAKKITELLDNTDKSKAFGEAGYQKAVKEFLLADQVKKYENMFLSR